MNYRVVFSADGFDTTECFNSASECDNFARMIAEQGRMIRVVADGLDITDKYVKTVDIWEVIARR